jgi:hypothetical protein
MPVTRRRFLKWSAAWCALINILPLRACKSPSEPPSGDTLGAWLDTLIPADATPAATQLGVDRQLREKAQQDPEYAQMLKFGQHWLDAQARKRGAANFPALDEAGREAVTARAESLGDDKAEHIFFLKTRQDAFAYYYVQPESWAGLAYRGPPQPLGFMDYDQPPAAGTDDRA